MGRRAIVAGTGFEGRAAVIRRHCRDGIAVDLQREPNNRYDPEAIAVRIQVPVLFGLLGTSWKRIGYIKASAADGLAKHMDNGMKISGRVASFYAPPGKNFPRVSLELDYDLPKRK